MDNEPDWFKIEQMLPPKHKDVLGYVVDNEFAERTNIYMVGLLDGGWWVRYTEGSFPIMNGQIVTHWRFLPNPPDKS